MRILSIESSCDETAVAIVEGGRLVRANAIASQMQVHRIYSGVVPEIASRCHIQYMLPVIEQALGLMDGAGEDPLSTIDAIAVTRGPGLIGSLLVGVETAKSIAFARDIPLIPVHHTMGHLHSIFCELPEGQSRLFELPPEGEKSDEKWSSEAGDTRLMEKSGRDKAAFDYPFLGLVISGGHSSLIRVDGPAEMRTIGSTLDDAPGEAYDKVAKCLGLGYPGGPVVDKLASEGDPTAFDLPRPILHSKDYNFSFSGLKTAVVRVIEDNGGIVKFAASENAVRDLCASFQEAVIDVLLGKSLKALKGEGLFRLAVVGGVACNRGLRAAAAKRLKSTHLVFPPPVLCTDNAAMIGAAAYHVDPVSREEALSLNAQAGWNLS
ncbi:MAG: tRNA (adenosine(37)-N6)-threonylcarbamoyltransferase complex transferase subunit TsaD [Candidatus Sumerlaeia bacterium]